MVGSLPTHDPTGAAYEIGLAGEHQRVNAGLALRLCATWIEARRRQPQKQGQGTAATTEENAPSVPVKNNSVAQDCVIDKNGVSDATSFIVATNTSGETNKVAFLGGVEDVDEKDDSGKEALLRPVEVHRGLSECAWPGRCQVGEKLCLDQEEWGDLYMIHNLDMFLCSQISYNRSARLLARVCAVCSM